MALTKQSLIVAIMFCYVELSIGFNRNLSAFATAPYWSAAGATWYGSPNGAGTDGGSCGYGNLVSQYPFSSMITALSSSLYNSGKECGACYQVNEQNQCERYKWSYHRLQQFGCPRANVEAAHTVLLHGLPLCYSFGRVKCTKSPYCSGKAVRVVITDVCPGCLLGFDLSGSSFGAMAFPGQEHKLRGIGVLEIQYARVACDYSGKGIEFHVERGSNSNYFASAIVLEGGDGDLAGVELKDASSQTWRPMQQSWGAIWKFDAASHLHPPLSLRLTSGYSGRTIIATDVIPHGWMPGATYTSYVNF
ncbi:hypothetical protein CsatA_018011 [Cannabis sativa]